MTPFIKNVIRPSYFQLIGADGRKNELGYSTVDDMIDKIENDLFFYPEDEPVFSLFGCKKVDGKVRATFYIEDDDEETDQNELK